MVLGLALRCWADLEMWHGLSHRHLLEQFSFLQLMGQERMGHESP